VINGGIVSQTEMHEQLRQVDGVMLGRAVYSDPWLIADRGKTRAAVVQAMYEYAKGKPCLRHITRHMLGLFHALPRARLWRRMLSDAAALAKNDPRLLLDAIEAVEGRYAEAA
jgi:tRNA-dihydrouridine synthase A